MHSSFRQDKIATISIAPLARRGIASVAETIIILVTHAKRIVQWKILMQLIRCSKTFWKAQNTSSALPAKSGSKEAKDATIWSADAGWNSVTHAAVYTSNVTAACLVVIGEMRSFLLIEEGLKK